ncbi:MAG: hypothetical protein QOG51_1330 [Verrucomicrobiota bacterium]|jgi:hypothetical protein
MARKNRPESWFDRHKSAIFIFWLFIIGLALVTTGLVFEAQEAEYQRYLGKLFIELSIACIVGCIATIFLSLREVRSQLSSVLGTLFSEGEVVGLLTRDARQLLNKKLLQYRLGSDVVQIKDELFERLTKLTDASLKSIHLEDYSVITTIQTHPTNTAFDSEQNVITFRINIAHKVGESGRLEFPFKIGYEIDLPRGTTMTDEEFLVDFELKVGNLKFKEAPVIRTEEGDVRSLRFLFEKKLEIDSATSVQLKYKVARLKADNISIWRAIYPTRQFQMTIQGAPDLDYGCKWFGSFSPDRIDENYSVLGDVITARRDDWFLPNEGIAISWTPKVAGPVASSGSVEPQAEREPAGAG